MENAGAPQADLAARVRRLEDREELRDLIVRYCLAVDNRYFDALVALFTADGAFANTGGIAARGRDEIRSFYSDRLSAYGPTFHYPHAQLVEFEGDHVARGIVPSHAEHGLDGTCVIAAIRYCDDYVRDEGVWRFLKRTIHFQYFMDTESLKSEYSSELRMLRGPTPGRADYPESLDTWRRFRAEVARRS